MPIETVTRLDEKYLGKQTEMTAEIGHVEFNVSQQNARQIVSGPMYKVRITVSFDLAKVLPSTQAVSQLHAPRLFMLSAEGVLCE